MTPLTFCHYLIKIDITSNFLYNITVKEIQIDQHTRYPLCILWEMGGDKMNIIYNDRTDLLYIRLDDRMQEVINRRVSEDIVLDIGDKDRNIGIEILNASKLVALEKILPIKYKTA